MSNPKRVPPHLQGVPPALLDLLGDDAKRRLADVATARERREWTFAHAVRHGSPEAFAAVRPRYLDGFSPDATRLFLRLDGPPGHSFTLADAERAGAEVRLDRKAVAEALRELRLAEYVADDGEGGDGRPRPLRRPVLSSPPHAA